MPADSIPAPPARADPIEWLDCGRCRAPLRFRTSELARPWWKSRRGPGGRFHGGFQPVRGSGGGVDSPRTTGLGRARLRACGVCPGACPRWSRRLRAAPGVTFTTRGPRRTSSRIGGVREIRAGERTSLRRSAASGSRSTRPSEREGSGIAEPSERVREAALELRHLPRRLGPRSRFGPGSIDAQVRRRYRAPAATTASSGTPRPDFVRADRFGIWVRKESRTLRIAAAPAERDFVSRLRASVARSPRPAASRLAVAARADLRRSEQRATNRPARPGGCPRRSCAASNRARRWRW